MEKSKENEFDDEMYSMEFEKEEQPPLATSQIVIPEQEEDQE